MPPSADLPGFLHGVAPILDRWGYLAVAGVIGVESFGVPAPGQTIMVAAAIYAGAGRLNVFAVAAIAFVASVLGDNVGYWIGVRGGRRLVHRFGRYILITPERLPPPPRGFPPPPEPGRVGGPGLFRGVQTQRGPRGATPR